MPSPDRFGIVAAMDLLLWQDLLRVLVHLLLPLGYLACGAARHVDRWASRTRWLAGGKRRLLVSWLAYFTFAAVVTIAVEAGFELQDPQDDEATPGWWLFKRVGETLWMGLFASVAVLGSVALLRRRPRDGWAWASGLYATCAFLFLGVVPFVIGAAMSSASLMRNPALESSLREVAARAGYQDPIVLVVAGGYEDTMQSRSHSFFARPMLSFGEQLIVDFDDDEIRLIAAHELAHHAAGDVWWGFALHVLVVGTGLAVLWRRRSWIEQHLGRRWGVPSLAEPAGMVLGILVVTTVVTMLHPLELAAARAMERRADARALDFMPDREVCVRTFYHLEWGRPPSGWLAYLVNATHPGLEERLAACGPDPDALKAPPAAAIEAAPANTLRSIRTPGPGSRG